MTPVPYPVAKLAAEAGFDEPTTWYYDRYGDGPIELRTTRDLPAICSAPLPADLADWLWRKWKVWCLCAPSRDPEAFGSYWNWEVVFANGDDHIGQESDPHTALLSALEAGLRWVCENKKT